MRSILDNARVYAGSALLAWAITAALSLWPAIRTGESSASACLFMLGAAALLPLLLFALLSLSGLLKRTREAPVPKASRGKTLAWLLAIEAIAMLVLLVFLSYALVPLVPRSLAYREEIAGILAAHAASFDGLFAGLIAWRIWRLPMRAFPLWTLIPLHVAARLWTDADIAFIAPGQQFFVDVLSIILCFIAARRFLGTRALNVGVPCMLLALLVTVVGSALRPGATATMISLAPSPGVALNMLRNLYDLDGDGIPAVLGGLDCNDADPHIHPLMIEVVGDGIDNNCMGGDLTRELPVVGASRRPSAPRHNVILVVIDALRADMPEQSRPVVMPTLRKLGKQGAVFTRAYAHASYTRESTRSLITGEYPMNMTAFGNRWFGMEAPLQVVLGAAGYQTSAITQLDFLDATGKGVGADAIAVLEHFDRIDNRGFDESFSSMTSASTTDRAIRELARLRTDPRPYFFWLHYLDPHAEYLPRKDIPFRTDTPAERYRGEVFATDRDFGRFVATLEKTGFFENGLLIVTADHGELFGEHGRYQHALSLDEEVLRVPLVVRGPGVPAGRFDTRVRHIDVFPTILEMAASIRAPRAGKSLSSIWQGQDLDDRDVVASTIYANRVIARAILQGRHKLVVDVTKSYSMLFDLGSQSPNENLIDARPDLRARLEQAMGKAWDTAINDRILARRGL